MPEILIPGALFISQPEKVAQSSDAFCQVSHQTAEKLYLKVLFSGTFATLKLAQPFINLV